MADTQPSELTAEQKAKRAASFGGVADHYERFRPGPPLEAVEWILPERARTVVDLGAGTGALSRLLVDRVDEVIAVEPDATDAVRPHRRRSRRAGGRRPG